MTFVAFQEALERQSSTVRLLYPVVLTIILWGSGFSKVRDHDSMNCSEDLRRLSGLRVSSKALLVSIWACARTSVAAKRRKQETSMEQPESNEVAA